MTDGRGHPRRGVLLNFPVDLWARHYERNQELLREFQLIASDGSTTSDVPRRLVEMATEFILLYGRQTDEITRDREAAREAGLTSRTSAVPLPEETPAIVERVRAMLREVDRFCLDESLLTQPRDWRPRRLPGMDHGRDARSIRRRGPDALAAEKGPGRSRQRVTGSVSGTPAPPGRGMLRRRRPGALLHRCTARAAVGRVGPVNGDHLLLAPNAGTVLPGVETALLQVVGVLIGRVVKDLDPAGRRLVGHHIPRSIICGLRRRVPALPLVGAGARLRIAPSCRCHEGVSVLMAAKPRNAQGAERCARAGPEAGRAAIRDRRTALCAAAPPP